MSLLWEILIGFILAIFIYNVVHHFFITRPADLGYEASTKILDRIVKKQIDRKKAHLIKRRDLSEVWERNIYVYEYIIEYADDIYSNQSFINDLKNNVKQLNEEKEYNHKIVVTDSFVLHNKIHVDLAYLLNSATYEYVLDMRKVNNIK